ncbi:NDP-hexose-3-ketoreductase [Actinoalloteichus hoggarensis]|uniref:Glucose--fructose oxidoreductase n=1 Tax=Actinoalloteichus hoggarensis TaxID=1470176 RepID=A0A221W4G5_9PSEU|nr:Gfo/Idh/MocA family oxidoreductase [Actinoalloteichus hoggarensis]ASO20664.1 Glucose--fructose oxidoreductase precursor [Actinoalloteichus hoggarensis]MBB5924483.1 NDP-hexose-3-ketoreductase [Actinoalloteichus hoggarensis]
MSSPIRFGVLGCGAFAQRRMIPALLANPNTTVTAVASRDHATAARVAARFGCVPTGYVELLDRDDIDAVYLAQPPASHERWVRAVLASGRHVLIEKPLATSESTARELVALARVAGRVLRENFLFPHHPRNHAVRGMLAEKRVGAPRFLTASFRIPPLPDGDIRYSAELGGGALTDLGVYPLRLAQYFLGDDVAVAGATLRMDRTRSVDLSGQVLLVSSAGVLAALDFGLEHSYFSRYSLAGETGRLIVDRAFTPTADWRPGVRIEEQDHVEESTFPAADQLDAGIASFAAAVRSGRGADVESREWDEAAVATARLVEAVNRLAIRVAVDDAD